MSDAQQKEDLPYIDRLMRNHERQPTHAGSCDMCHLANEIQRLRQDCAEAYQVVGTLADAAECFDTFGVQRVLDNLDAASTGEPRKWKSVLPFYRYAPRRLLSHRLRVAWNVLRGL